MHLTGRIASHDHCLSGAAKEATVPRNLACDSCSAWSQCFNVRVLADSGFDSNAFIDGVNALGLHGVIGSRADRDVGEGQHLCNLRY